MEQCVTLAHSMEKEHFVSFTALISFDRVQLVKLYPEQEPTVRFAGVRPAGGLLQMRRVGWQFTNGESTYPAIRGW